MGVIEKMQEFAKSLQKVTVSGSKFLLLNALDTPDEFTPAEICKVIEEQRPLVVGIVGDCRPNYAIWETVGGRLSTKIPDLATETLAADISAEVHYPAELSSSSNSTIESCRSLLRHSSGADWIESALTVLDVRPCLASGGSDKSKLSRSWVSDCIPKAEFDAGYPGWVFKFLHEYGAPGEDCIPSYAGFASGHCPSLCENGESLAGHLKTPDGIYYVLFEGAAGAREDLTDDQHKIAKQHIFNDGPIVGFVSPTAELAACARDDRIIYAPDCSAEDADWKADYAHVHSIVVHGWGSEGGTDFYRVVTSFQEDDHEARINQCSVKMFVIPKSTSAFAKSDYDKHLQAIKAEARCARGAGFCSANGGYTDTEDCDGDGVLDHWCYIVGDAETPTYEAFISSRRDCQTVERSCRRSVLPGRHFGCQRPLGWCMHGEHYYRDVDCDGDGHFDHVCEKAGHAGYISSSQDCLDTWEEGMTGLKCEPASVELAAQEAAPYKLVSDYGNCAPKDGTQCFVSHEDFSKANYPVGVCQFHVEWTQPPVTEAATASCDTAAQIPNETLWLEVVQKEIKGAVFNENGWLFGEQLKVNGINTKTSTNVQTQRNAAEFVRVKDKDAIRWTTDENVQEAGWLVCLRIKKKIPAVHKAKCSEIGADIWATYFTMDDPRTVVSVECDEKRCSKAAVKAVEGKTYSFYVTTNVCDAGWQAARSNKFDVAFTGATSSSEATFEVLL